MTTFSTQDFTLVFDNAGKVTLQLDNYSHLYDDVRDAAIDVAHILRGANPARDWDGHEEDATLDLETLEGQDYVIMDKAEVITHLHKDYVVSYSDNNVRDFFTVLEGIMLTVR